MRKRKELTVAEAKERFIESVDSIDPLKLIREKPIRSIGTAAVIGVALGFTKSLFMKRALAYSNLSSMLLKKIL
jgi:ElaB/YqjD/DUF883 family membrane-anchored ribosome-binding protein